MMPHRNLSERHRPHGDQNHGKDRNQPAMRILRVIPNPANSKKRIGVGKDDKENKPEN